MIDAQHYETFAINSILKHIGCAENLQRDLAIFQPSGNWPSEPWMSSQHLDFRDDFGRDFRGQRGTFVMQKLGESFEVGERGVDQTTSIIYAGREMLESPRYGAISRHPRSR